MPNLILGHRLWQAIQLKSIIIYLMNEDRDCQRTNYRYKLRHISLKPLLWLNIVNFGTDSLVNLLLVRCSITYVYGAPLFCKYMGPTV